MHCLEGFSSIALSPTQKTTTNYSIVNFNSWLNAVLVLVLVYTSEDIDLHILGPFWINGYAINWELSTHMHLENAKCPKAKKCAIQPQAHTSYICGQAIYVYGSVRVQGGTFRCSRG